MHASRRPSALAARLQVGRLSAAGRLFAAGVLAAGLLAAGVLVAAPASGRRLHAVAVALPASASGTVWLCRPGQVPDPCASSLATTVITASGARSTRAGTPVPATGFDCFYVYPTVSPESGSNSDLQVGAAEVDAAVAQASRFSQVCRVYAPMYRQVTLSYLASHPDLNLGPPETVTAFDSIRAGFEDFLAHESDGRPLILIGHSQGAALTILLLQRLVDAVPALRDRLVMAIILGGNVAVPTGRLVGGTFQHIPACDRTGETGCVIAYSSFPGLPPAASLFGRPGQGVSLQSNQVARTGLEVVCVDPAGIATGAGPLDPYFPALGTASTPWVSYPGLYSSRCEHEDGASWLDVTKATGSSDHRPLVTEEAGPLFGYHASDVNLALGNLVADVAAAESTWTASHR